MEALAFGLLLETNMTAWIKMDKMIQTVKSLGFLKMMTLRESKFILFTFLPSTGYSR